MPMTVTMAIPIDLKKVKSCMAVMAIKTSRIVYSWKIAGRRPNPAFEVATVV